MSTALRFSLKISLIVTDIDFEIIFSIDILFISFLPFSLSIHTTCFTFAT